MVSHIADRVLVVYWFIHVLLPLFIHHLGFLSLYFLCDEDVPKQSQWPRPAAGAPACFSPGQSRSQRTLAGAVIFQDSPWKTHFIMFHFVSVPAAAMNVSLSSYLSHTDIISGFSHSLNIRVR